MTLQNDKCGWRFLSVGTPLPVMGATRPTLQVLLDNMNALYMLVELGQQSGSPGYSEVVELT